jgi:hypothetical protein
MQTIRRALIPALIIVAAVVAACSPSGGTPTPATAAPAASTPAGLSAGAPDFAKIQQCLAAAGITAPSGGFGPLPSGVTAPSGSFAPPSGFTPPSGGFSGGATDPAVAAALKACGITLPAASSNP